MLSISIVIPGNFPRDKFPKKLIRYSSVKTEPNWFLFFLLFNKVNDKVLVSLVVNGFHEYVQYFCCYVRTRQILINWYQTLKFLFDTGVTLYWICFINCRNFGDKILKLVVCNTILVSNNLSIKNKKITIIIYIRSKYLN